MNHSTTPMEMARIAAGKFGKVPLRHRAQDQTNPLRTFDID